ncbi:WD40 repeat-like protein [Pisolithus marmoratus]|nr:WD40 repeat-like protein [Pisolithus marmoratus]
MIGISTEFGSTISIVSHWMALGDAHSYVKNEENDPRPLVTGCTYLHSHSLGPIFHGDLKGVSIVIRNARAIVERLLSDFGLSTLQNSTFSMTVYPWLAPELLDDYTPSTEGDVWAFGMTVLELFTRLRPFHDCPSNVNVMHRLVMGRLPPRPSEESTLSRMTDPWWEICTSCWRREPSSRPSMKELTEKVKGATAGPAMAPPTVSLPVISTSKDTIFSPDRFSRTLSSLGDNPPLRSTAMLFHDFLPSCTGIPDKVLSVAFSPDGKRIVSGSADNSVCLWDMETRARVGSPLKGHVGWARSVAFSPDGKWVVSGSYDKTIRLWDARRGAPAGSPLRGHSAKVLSVAFSPDGRTVVSGSSDKTIYVVQSVAMSPDGTRIVSGSHDKTLRLWDTKTGAQIGRALEGHSGMVFTVAFSPDSKMVVSGSDDNILRLWDTRAGVQVGRPLIGHGGAVNSVAFSPDGMWVVSGSVDTNVFLWDARAGARVGTPLKGNAGWVRSVVFSPSGREVVAGTEDGSICLWNARVH